MIPNLAIHMNREANSGYKYNIQKDMLPIVGEASSKGKLMKLVAENAGVKEEDILSTDLFLYNRVKGTVWGLEKEFLSVGRLDDLQCAFASMKGFLGQFRARVFRSAPFSTMRKWAAVQNRALLRPSWRALCAG